MLRQVLGGSREEAGPKVEADARFLGNAVKWKPQISTEARPMALSPAALRRREDEIEHEVVRISVR
jgi:hypothetical protein